MYIGYTLFSSGVPLLSLGVRRPRRGVSPERENKLIDEIRRLRGLQHRGRLRDYGLCWSANDFGV